MIGVYFCWSLLFLWNVCVTSDDAKKLHVKEADTCPTDKSSWEKASRDLNCTPSDRYQCTPNENQTALLEFCYHQPPTFVEKGYCWILSNSHFTDTYSCAGFTEGCPNRTYRSNELYKYQQCLQLNKLEGCYLADPECPNQMNLISTDLDDTTSHIIIGVMTIGISIIVLIAAIVVVRRFRVCKSHEEGDDEEKSLLLDATHRVEGDGENVRLQCILSKKIQVRNIKWSKDGREIKLKDAIGKYNVEEDKLAFVIESAGQLDRGEYVCCIRYAYNCKGIVKEVKFSLESPKITLGRIQADGDDVIIEYEVSVSEECKSLTTLSWKRNECDLNLSDEADKYAGGTLDDSFLRIRSFNMEMLGRYECTAGNIFGKDTLTCILEGPNITLGQILPDGDDIVIEYAVSVSDACKSLTSLSWKRNGFDLNLSDESDKYAGGKLNDSFLRIRRFNKEMMGRYDCTARNIFGKSDITFTLDEIQCSPKECQCFLLNCLLLDNFRLCENEPGEWEEKLNFSWKFYFRETKKNIKENGLAIIKSGKLRDHILCEHNECKLISPENIFNHFLQRSGFLDFFLEHACSQNIGIFCRSPGYRKDQGETCCTVSPEQFKIVVQRLRFDILNNASIKDKTCHQTIEDLLSIPKGILSLGRERISRYLEDLTHGQHVVYVARGMLVGCEGAGKTSLLCRLRGEGTPNPPSTRGVAVHINVFSVDGKNLEVATNQNTPSLRSNLRGQEDPSQDQDIAVNEKQSSVKDTLKTENIESDQISIEIPPTTAEMDDSQVAKIIDKKETRENKDSKENIKRNETDVDGKLNDDIFQTNFSGITSENTEVCPGFSINEILSESFALENRKIVTFFDFAGQFAYYSCHHIYFSPNDFYILAMDITKNLDDPVTINKSLNREDISNDMSDGRRKMERSIFSNWTYLQFTEFWIQSILSHSVGVEPAATNDDSTPSKMAPLILVATHAEPNPEEKGEKYFKDLRTRLPKLSVHIDYTNAIGTGYNADLSIAKIKDRILKVVQILPNWGKRIPLSWFYIENQIRKLKDLKIIKTDELLIRCSSNDVGIQSKDDLIAPLLFLHNIGVILFFDEENLRDFVTLDVQWFVDAFKHIITDERHAELDIPQDLYEKWERFNENGLLTSSLMFSIWGKCEKDYPYNTKKMELISLMIKLNLFTEVSLAKDTTISAKWYCPCMNKRTFPTEKFENLQNKSNTSNSSLLCFNFNYLPMDLFHRLIAACGNQLTWKIFEMVDLCIYQTATLFDVKNSKVLVGMHNNDKILVQYLDLPESKTADYLDIRGKISQLINGLTEKLVNCEYEVGFMCKSTVFGKSNLSLSHFIPESKMTGDTIVCHNSRCDEKVTVKHIKWHGQQKNSNGNRQRSMSTAQALPMDKGKERGSSIGIFSRRSARLVLKRHNPLPEECLTKAVPMHKGRREKISISDSIIEVRSASASTIRYCSPEEDLTKAPPNLYRRRWENPFSEEDALEARSAFSVSQRHYPSAEEDLLKAPSRYKESERRLLDGNTMKSLPDKTFSSSGKIGIEVLQWSVRDPRKRVEKEKLPSRAAQRDFNTGTDDILKNLKQPHMVLKAAVSNPDRSRTGQETQTLSGTAGTSKIFIPDTSK